MVCEKSGGEVSLTLINLYRMKSKVIRNDEKRVKRKKGENEEKKKGKMKRDEDGSKLGKEFRARRFEKKSQSTHRELHVDTKILEFHKTPLGREFSYFDYV